MANGVKNNGKGGIELLPEEFRRKEEKKKREERPEVKMFIPPISEKTPKQEKSSGQTFFGKIFGFGKKIKPGEQKKKEEPDDKVLGVFSIQKEFKKISSDETAPLLTETVSQTPEPEKFPRETREIIQAKKEISPPLKMARPPLAGKGVIPPKSKFGITLIPEETVSPEEAARPRQKIILAVVLLILVLSLGGSFAILKQNENKIKNDLDKVEKNIAAVGKEISDLEEGRVKAQTLQKQFNVADKLLEKHIYWTEVFSYIEKNTVAEVYFKNLVGASDGSLNMSGVAKSYKAVAEQIVALRDAENTEKVSITSASASVFPTGEIAEVNFEAKLKLRSEIFLK